MGGEPFHKKAGALASRREWPSLAQVLRQLGIAALVVVVWAIVFVGYMYLTGEESSTEEPGLVADAPAPTSVPTVATHDAPTHTPVPLETTGLSFARDVLPIFENRCLKCHGGQRTSAGLGLKTFADVMAGSRNGAAIEPGNAAGSYLVELILSGDMPKREPRLLPTEIQIISDWIDAGALDN